MAIFALNNKSGKRNGYFGWFIDLKPFSIIPQF